jgi:putative phosphoribosyl transferase
LLFANREHAGQLLAAQLGEYRAIGPVVIGLARGGVPVAAVVAETMGAPLGVLSSHRLSVPGEPERAVGAVAPGVRFILDDVVRELDISAEYLQTACALLEQELAERSRAFQASKPPDVSGRNVILVDDGIASGATAAAAVQSVRQGGAQRVIVAAPVAVCAALELLRMADEVVVPFLRDDSMMISATYTDFGPLTDIDVRAIVVKAQRSLVLPP